MNKWDRRMLDLAHLVASWSKDPSTKVGAVIADAQHRVVSLGFNGPPSRVPDGEMGRDKKLAITIHAEENALLFAQQNLVDCTMYVTHPPCARCASKIIQMGVLRVVAVKAPSEFESRWADSIKMAEDLMRDAPTLFITVDNHESILRTDVGCDPV